MVQFNASNLKPILNKVYIRKCTNYLYVQNEDHIVHVVLHWKYIYVHEKTGW